MSNSAFVGQPPTTFEDRLIIRGYARRLGVTENMSDPTQVFPLPPGKSLDCGKAVSINPTTITCLSLAMALILLMTGTRLCLRGFWKNLRIGYDDLVIIPAAIGALSWYSLMIAMTIYGGAGKHIRDITYHELDYFYRVSLVTWRQEPSKTTNIHRNLVCGSQPNDLPHHRHTDSYLHYAVKQPPHRPHVPSVEDKPARIPPHSHLFPHDHYLNQLIPMCTTNN